ncbi:MAG: HAMP domain-containing sensor histidine kinase [Clostridium sp.]
MRNLVQQSRENIYHDSSFSEELARTSYVLYNNLHKKSTKNENIKPGDYLYSPPPKEYDNVEEMKKDPKEYINISFYEWQKQLKEGLKNLEFYALDTKSGVVDSYTMNEIDKLVLSPNDGSSYDIKDKFSFYIVIEYDDSGRMKVLDIKGANQEGFTSGYNVGEEREYLADIKNMKVAYGVAKDIKYSDDIFNMAQQQDNYSYVDTVNVFTGVAVAIVIIAALLIPIRRFFESLVMVRIIKLPFELILLGGIFAYVNLSYSYEIVRQSLSGNLHYLYIFSLGKIGQSQIGIFISNVIHWFVGLSLIFILVVVLKYIKHVGFKEYMGRYSLLNSIKPFLKRIKSYYTNIDFREKNTKRLMTLVIINFVIVSIMCSIWFFGIGVAVIYSIILFNIFRRYVNGIREKYNKLFEATNKMAEGNLDVKIEGDLGVFEPFKEQIESIQMGFKESVSKEVKSQTMKTELISNVSHDLKTPLTSIVTYVHLLKDKDLTEDKRLEYLEVLDRKTLRLQHLIEDLFEVSKATSGNINLTLEKVDIVSLMKQTLLELDDQTSKTALQIRANYSSPKIVLDLDGQRIFRVFENLILNATKYALEGSRVYVDIEEGESNVSVTIKNITRDEINYNPNDLTERFVRGDKSRNTEGSGLGLAIAKSFVNLHGGELNITVDGDLFKVEMIFKK